LALRQARFTTQALASARDRGLPTGSIIERRHRAIGQRPLNTALNGLMVHPHVLCHRKNREDDAGEGPERLDRLAEGQSRQGIGGNCHSGFPPGYRAVSEANRDEIYARTVSRRPLRIAGPDCRPDRPAIWYAGLAASSAGRDYESLCGDKRHALCASTRHPDLC
jgi:hypothetical protein